MEPALSTFDTISNVTIALICSLESIGGNVDLSWDGLDCPLLGPGRSGENLEVVFGDNFGCSSPVPVPGRSGENLEVVFGEPFLLLDWKNEGADVVMVPSNLFFLLWNSFFFLGFFFD